jgi:hypothetical protein
MNQPPFRVGSTKTPVLCSSSILSDRDSFGSLVSYWYSCPVSTRGLDVQIGPFLYTKPTVISVKTISNIKRPFHVSFLWHDVSKNEDYGGNS